MRLFSYFNIKKIIFFICLVLFAPLGFIQAQDTIRLDGDFESKRIGNFFAYYVDRQQLPLDVEEIANQHFDTLTSLRHILNFDFINFGEKEKMVWLKFQVLPERNLSEKKHFFLEVKSPLLDEIVFYHYEKGEWHSQVTGGHFSLRKRLFEHRTYIFDLHLSPHQVNTFYIKVASADMMNIYPILHERNAFVKLALNEQMGFGILYGLLFALLVINFIYRFVHKKLIYSLFTLLILIGTMVIIRINGHSYVYLGTVEPWLENRTVPLLILVFVIVISLFSFKLLSRLLKEQFLYKGLIINIFISASFFIITLFNVSSWVISSATVIGLFNVFAVFITSVYEILKGETENKFFVTGSYLFFIGVLLTFFRFFDVIETNSFLGAYGFEMGFIGFVALTTISLKLRHQNGGL
jgi:two-component system, NtrC family, sensor kinase